MNVQIALLRAVNVGGNSTVAMADLRTLAASIGLMNVRSVLQSGNLVFDAGSRSPAATEKILEGACAKKFGLRTEIYVRTPTELDQIIARNPFPSAAKDDPSHLVVLFVRAAPDAKSFSDLQAAIRGRELVRGIGRHAYITYPDGIGRSKLTGPTIEQHLGAHGTARNWNTLLKLTALATE